MKHRAPSRGLVIAVALASGALSGARADVLSEVPNANPKLPGMSVPTLLSPELRQSAVSEGAQRLGKSPDGI